MISAINPYQSVIGVDAGKRSLETEEDRLMDACRGFEALFIEQMMKSMRNATIESDFVKKSSGEKIFTEMLDSEFSMLASAQSEGGLASIMFEQLKDLIPADALNSKLSEQAGLNAYGVMGENFSLSN